MPGMKHTARTRAAVKNTQFDRSVRGESLPGVNAQVYIDYSIGERAAVSRRIAIHHWPPIHGLGIINQLDPHLFLPPAPPAAQL